jgi:hypothetical protein
MRGGHIRPPFLDERWIGANDGAPFRDQHLAEHRERFGDVIGIEDVVGFKTGSESNR